MNETTQNTIHIPVLADEVIQVLKPEPHQKYIDATLGGGGHTALLLESGASVLGFDQDSQAIEKVSKRFSNNRNLQIVNANFITIATKAATLGFDQVDGILFDLGVSSFQLDTPERGFSFNFKAPLDMRMNQSASQTAADIVNTMSEDELFELLITNSQEMKARQIAKAIVMARPVSTTTQLAEIVSKVYGNKRGKIHPATKTFQAIRIAVNQELKIIKPTLKDAFSLLKPGGRLAVISFHEGEDRIVKRTFLEFVESGQAIAPKPQPLVPGNSELTHNTRSRSAKLRYLERLK